MLAVLLEDVKSVNVTTELRQKPGCCVSAPRSPARKIALSNICQND